MSGSSISFSGITSGTFPLLVAEIGQNHNGDPDIALQLIDQAIKAGFHAVKFTKRDLTYELTQAAWEKPREGNNAFGNTYGEHRKALELSRESFQRISDYCAKNNILFFCTACDPPSVDFLESIGNPFYKVASRDLTNIPLLEYIAQTGKGVILSTGMASSQDIEEALNVFEHDKNKVILLQCSSLYPTPSEKINLRVLQTFREQYRVPVGLSDHTPSILPAVLSMAYNVVYIEKHITLSRTMKGTDHTVSLEYPEMVELVRQCREAHTMLGIPEKKAEPETEPIREKLERSLVAKHKIPEGHVLTEQDLMLKSPGTGLKWRDRNKITGKKAVRDIAGDTILQETDFKA